MPTTAEILTVTLNPALDLSTTAPQVLPGPKLRCAAPEVEPGGGGVNVARAIGKLGGRATALVVVGGPTGARLVALLEAEGVPTIPLAGPGETRQSVAVTDAASGAQYRFVLPGPDWRVEDQVACLQAIRNVIGPGELLVLSGSLPPGVSEGFPVDLARLTAESGARLIADTSGVALARLAAGHGGSLDTLRLDQGEAEALAGRPLPRRADTADFARSLVARGAARIVILGRGPDGSVLTGDGESWHCAGAEVPVVSKVGAGDSFVGGYTLARARGAPLPDCLRYGTAAASAAVTTGATHLCDCDTTERLVAACALTRL